MPGSMGLWIDHRKAVIVSVADNQEEIRVITSGVEKQPRRSGDSPLKGPYEALQAKADDIRNRSFAGHLNAYYDAVMAGLREAESILILGPGEAKVELRKRLQEGAGRRILAMETADKMTDRQIAARVRQYFLKQASESEFVTGDK